jgi:hypothetical protein
MLRFCFERLPEKNRAEKEKYLHLEAFLLHYRNLIEFLAGSHRHRKGDLCTAKPKTWLCREPSPSELTALRAISAPAINLYNEHWDQISKYLQHCTSVRAERDRFWDAELMMKKIDPIIAEFERAFPC